MLVLSIATPVALLLIAAVAYPRFRMVLALMIVAVVVLLAFAGSNEDFQRFIDWAAKQ